MTIHNTPDTESSFTHLTPENEQAEAERWYRAFISETEDVNELLKANLRLEEILLLSKNERLRNTFVGRVLELAMERCQHKEKLSYREEFFVIHSILTIGEVIRHHKDLINTMHITTMYTFTRVSSTIVSGLAHQKFQEIIAEADSTTKKKVFDALWVVLK
ncbi:MAG: hypothetical protein A2666_01025 [Parcubacteria group bacterium RIFCSPHIGHO2_01_FULL_47_10b]|nr:MAG: hypothetical protein A2666_01025 [Parcubacteria group bacterium RIFCSPHIGHO2_01_FULL_47_10b]